MRLKKSGKPSRIAAAHPNSTSVSHAKPEIACAHFERGSVDECCERGHQVWINLRRRSRVGDRLIRKVSEIER